MHRKLIVFMILILGLSNPLYSQPPNPKPEAAAQQVVIEFFEALSKLDSVALSNTVTTDFLLLEDGAVWNTDSLTTQFRWMVGKSFQRINKLQFVRTEIRGNTCWLAYHNQADVTFNGRPMVWKWLESAVLVRAPKGWKIRMLHSTVKK